eukprot:3110665-Pleurochrysis_carterae.AAC.1
MLSRVCDRICREKVHVPYRRILCPKQAALNRLGAVRWRRTLRTEAQAGQALSGSRSHAPLGKIASRSTRDGAHCRFALHLEQDPPPARRAASGNRGSARAQFTNR